MTIPQKLYYRIGEVAELAGVKPHVLRYWETEFGFLSPEKSDGNQRTYTRRDLEKVLTIKRLLYEERFTVAGAKKRFRQEWGKAQDAPPQDAKLQLVRRLKTEVKELLEFLGKNDNN